MTDIQALVDDLRTSPYRKVSGPRFGSGACEIDALRVMDERRKAADALTRLSADLTAARRDRDELAALHTEDTALLRQMTDEEAEAEATISALRAEVEALRGHIMKMQGYVQEYLEPGPYVAKHGEGGTFNEPHKHQGEGYAYFMRQKMREAVLNDLIYMLDGPEERAVINVEGAKG